MEAYIKMSKETRRKLILNEQQKYTDLFTKNTSNPDQFITVLCTILLNQNPLLSSNLPSLIIRDRAICGLLSQSENLSNFLYAADNPKYRSLFLLNSANFIPPDTETLDITNYWVVPLLANIHFIAQICKAVRAQKQPELQKKFVYVFKPLLTKNICTADFANKLAFTTLGKDFYELLYLIRTFMGLISAESNLISASMDIASIIPHALGRIPFIGAVDKLRSKILQIYEINSLITANLIQSTFNILGYEFAENEQTQKKKAEMSMFNLLYLLKKMYDLQSAPFIDQLKIFIPTLPDNNVTLIILRILKIPPTEPLRNIIINILAQCVAQSKYSLLIDLMQKHNIAKTLIGYLKYPEVQYNCLLLLQFFLVGFQITPTAFHVCIGDFEKILIQLTKSSAPSLTFATNFITLLIILIRLFPGYPVQYTPIVVLIKDLILKYHIAIPSESKIDETIKTTSWLKITQQLSGTSSTANLSYYSASVHQNTSGYKGLANCGNSIFFNN